MTITVPTWLLLAWIGCTLLSCGLRWIQIRGMKRLEDMRRELADAEDRLEQRLRHQNDLVGEDPDALGPLPADRKRGMH